MLQQLLQERQKLGTDSTQGGFNWQIIETPQPGERIGANLLQKPVAGGDSWVFIRRDRRFDPRGN